MYAGRKVTKRGYKRAARRTAKTKSSYPMVNTIRGDTPTIVEVGTWHYLDDTTNKAYDVFGGHIRTNPEFTKYTDMYNQFAPISIEFRFEPYFINSTVNTDIAHGIFAIRQNFIDPVPVTYTPFTLMTFPVSKPFRNQKSFYHKEYFQSRKYFDWGEDHTANTGTPKLMYYFGYIQTATSNYNKGVVYLKMRFYAKGKRI